MKAKIGNPDIRQACVKCGVIYPRTSEFFYRNANFKDGLHSQCKYCLSASQLAWQKANRRHE